jgi:predicted transcriptional regulator
LCYSFQKSAAAYFLFIVSTTSIRLPDELKQRVVRAAERAGLSPHAFMLEAIARRLEAEERRSDFQMVAEQRYERILATGETIPWSAMRGYLQRRLAGETVAGPDPGKRKPR